MKWIPLVGIASIGVLGGCLREEENPVSPSQVAGISHKVGEIVENGRLIVTFETGASRRRRDDALRGLAAMTRHHEDHNTPKGGRSRVTHFDRLATVQLDPTVTAREAAEKLASDPDVELVESDRTYKIQTTPNDSKYSQQWNMNKISAPTAWDLTRGSTSVVVAVIDTGVDYTHPDLAANMWKNPGEIANGIDDDGNGYVDDIYGYDFAYNDPNPQDDVYHGTHLAGIIGAIGNNTRGVAGVCWTVSIMAVKSHDSAGTSYLSDVISSIQYAVNEGAHIISASWGAGGLDQTLQSAINAAHNAGVLFVGAAMNDNTDANVSPACLKNVLAVAATDSSDNKATFSNYGAQIAVAAPGVNIYSTLNSIDYGTDAYGVASGTSMACPHVAGLAALLKARKPALTNVQIASIIRASADDRGAGGWDPFFGNGRINARRALDLADLGHTQFPTASITSPLNKTTVGAQFSISGTASGSYFAGYALEYYASSGTWVQTATSTTPVTGGALGTADLSGLPDGLCWIRLTVNDSRGYKIFAGISVIKEPAPWCTITNPLSGSTASGTVVIKADAWCKAGVYRMKTSIDGESRDLDLGAHSEYSWYTEYYSNGVHRITVTAEDVSGTLFAQGTVAVTVSNAPNSAYPTCAITSPANGATVSGTITVKASATDNMAVTKVLFIVDGVISHTDTTAAYTYALDTTILSNGSHTLAARAVDGSLKAMTSLPVTIAVNNSGDTKAPTCSITSPTNGATVTGIVTVKATAADNTGVTKVNLLVDGAYAKTDATAPYSFSWDTSTLTKGTHTLKARAFDAAGNPGTSTTIAVTVK